ncbi:hypothetical protein HYDPIDRAFT_105071 [Hydnomerulius pinastri MD-312]|nr:hypothetical protein HYDPIDRAFT_105071 [Hydnomerulius pinastri MD-312]
MMATLKQVLDALVVPSAFSQHERITDDVVLTELYTWKSKSQTWLTQLETLEVPTLSLSDQADLVRVLAPLTAIGQWSSANTRSIASAQLDKVSPSRQLISHVLTQVIKPLFAPTPHPRLHTDTARVLTRPADTQDTYHHQPWKAHPGLDEIVRWCILNIEPSAYESTWPLLLPPVMSFLDDYQAPYKVLGVRLVSHMLTRVPPELLVRTGVDALLFTSLTNSLNHLRDPSTPELIRMAVPATLQLIDLTTPSVLSSTLHPHRIPAQATPTALAHTLTPSQSKSLSTRFTRLSTLLSSSLIGTVITYTPTLLPPDPAPAQNPDPFSDPDHEASDPPDPSPHTSSAQEQPLNPTLIAASQVLPPVLSALGIGGARFLKGILPILVGWLALPILSLRHSPSNDPYAYNSTDAHFKQVPDGPLALHLSALSSLTVLLETCAPRIGRWATTIVDALGRCWVGCTDVEGKNGLEAVGDEIYAGGLGLLKRRLREMAVRLGEVCPSVVENEYVHLLAFDSVLFGGLVGGIGSGNGADTKTHGPTAEAKAAADANVGATVCGTSTDGADSDDEVDVEE